MLRHELCGNLFLRVTRASQTVKVKNDPYVAAKQDCSIVDAPPAAKKSRGRPAKTPVVASAPRAPNPTRQATVPSPPPPAEIAPFQFTAGAFPPLK